MLKEYEGYLYENSDIQAGDLVQILSVMPNHCFSYPPVGSVVEVVLYRDSPVLDCNSWGKSLRNGLGITYRILNKNHELRGIAKFLKERSL
jgi:hypothetical protein